MEQIKKEKIEIAKQLGGLECDAFAVGLFFDSAFHTHKELLSGKDKPKQYIDELLYVIEALDVLGVKHNLNIPEDLKKIVCE